MGFDYLYKDGEKACASEPLKVLLDGHPYGEIRKVETGYQHFPEGKKKGGVIFSKVSEVQNSLHLSRHAKVDRKPAAIAVGEDVTANGKLIEEIDKMKTDANAVNEKLAWAKTLLTAAFDLFELQKDSENALNLLEESVAYDDAVTDVVCDGHRLQEDILKLIESIE